MKNPKLRCGPFLGSHLKWIYFSFYPYFRIFISSTIPLLTTESNKGCVVFPVISSNMPQLNHQDPIIHPQGLHLTAHKVPHRSCVGIGHSQRECSTPVLRRGTHTPPPPPHTHTHTHTGDMYTEARIFSLKQKAALEMKTSTEKPEYSV